MVLTIPYKYQVRFNESDYDVVSNIDDEVDPYYIKELRKLPDFVKGYDGMDVSEFDDYGPVNITLDQFLKGYDDLVNIIRGFMISF
jgi:transaldolase